MSVCNIVDLIENNPITKLSNTYQNKLLTKIKENFSDAEQQLFVSSFYCFLNYNQRTDFVIDLDNIWEWLGFSQKVRAKELLEKNFIENTDYKLLSLERKQKDTRGGHNKETIMLTVRTFKLFCLKAGTKKAQQIHEYYIKLEETLQEVIQEESNELKIQLETKTIELQNTEKNNKILREKTLLEQFPLNTQCFYYGIIDNVSNNNEKLIKFGNSNNLKSRVDRHKDTYTNFWLMNAFKVDNKTQIESAFKYNTIFSERIRTILIKSKNYVELLNIDGLSFTDLDKIIKDIITSIEYSPEKYVKILEENKLLKKQLDEAKNINNTYDMVLLSSENKKLKNDNLDLIKKYNRLKNKFSKLKKSNNDSEDDDKLVNEKDEQLINEEDEQLINEPNIVCNTKNYITTINNFNKKNKKPVKNADGFYYVNGNKYIKLFGTRQDVCDNIAYKTSGGLTISDLIINKSGKIVSKKKSIQEIQNNKFFIHGVNSSMA